MKIDRASAIRQHLFDNGQSTITEISQAVGASEPTVRRDLAVLEAEGQVLRTHGGARIAETSGIEVAFERREHINLAAKRAIGAAAYKLLRPGTAIFLDAGTTVLQLARRLRLSPMPLRVFTNCLPVAQILMPHVDISVTLIGGTLRPQNASMVGILAEEALNRLWFDQVFLGAGAIGDDANIYSADDQEARLNAIMLSRTQAAIILADADKFDQKLTYKVSALDVRCHIVTDAELSEPWQARTRKLGCRLTQASL